MQVFGAGWVVSMISGAVVVPSLLFGQVSEEVKDSTVAKTGVETVNVTVADTENGESEEKEAMEIGGVVTVDAAARTSSLEDATMEIGTVELSAVVNVAEGVTASITLLAESDLTTLSIDAAVVEWVSPSKPLTLVFGQQTYNFGLLTTQMISDPLIIDMVETVGPGVTASMGFKNLRSGIGVLYQKSTETLSYLHYHMPDYSIIYDTTDELGDKQKFIGNLYFDYSFSDNMMARVSMLANNWRFDVDVGLGYAGDVLAIDAEFYIKPNDEHSMLPSGWLAGCAWAFNDLVTAAVRYDAVSENDFSETYHRIGGGMTLHMKYGIFLAMEYGHLFAVGDPGTGEVALQLGLESSLKLPGFQRKTLTKKN